MARVLCLHGMGGTGATMWPLVAALGSAGHTTFAPTLPGHGGAPSDLVGATWADWLAAALDWPADVVVGQSMGGSLALAVAATGAGACHAVAAINPLPPDPDAVDGLEWRLGRGHEWVEDVPVFPGEIAYNRLPISALVAMTTGVLGIDLGAVRQPVLLVSSAHDEVVDPAGAAVIAGALGGPVRRVTLALGGHVATLDADRTRLCTAVEAFIRTTL